MMTGMVSLQPWTALARRRAARGPEPLVTYVDAGSGERTELSATSVENAVAKIANALRDEFDLDRGSVVGLHLPWHWQRSLWWGACAAIGARVVPFADPASVDLLACTPADLAALASPERSAGPGSEREALVVSMHPLGLPLADPLPEGFADATPIIRAQPDAFWPDPAAGAMDVPVPDDARTGQRTLVAVAQRHAAPVPGPAPANDLDDSWWWALAIPLAIDGSVVMVRVPEDPSIPATLALIDRIAEQERADRVVCLPG
ncbi:MAG: hypothetical protein KGP12_01495 [Actinomycetales bacterium]|nr:hypothetical protein [Actinomycetales bacterium]